MPRPISRLTLFTLAIGILLVAIFTAMVLQFREDFRGDVRQKIIERDAAMLHPVALQKLAEIDANRLPGGVIGPDELSAAVVRGKWADGKGILAVVIFDATGNPLRTIPDSLLFADLSAEDFFRMQTLRPISRYREHFRLDRYFVGVSREQREAPILEVLLPLYGSNTGILGFAQYYIDAAPLAVELAAIDRRYNRLTIATLGIGAGLIALVMCAAYLALRRAERAISERNERLTRANFELTLAAKASALGQITSHLIHGLQGSVAGLRAVVAEHGVNTDVKADWRSAADYTERMQAMIQEVVALLGDTSAQAVYELTGRELATAIQHRNAALAAQKNVTLNIGEGFDSSVDNHRGSMLCLIVNNLVQNAIEATPSGRKIDVSLRNGDGTVTFVVTDQGHGIPESAQLHLFEPGRSGRPGGSGLGLAISHLLARQIGAELTLISSGPEGTTFRLVLPLN